MSQKGRKYSPEFRRDALEKMRYRNLQPRDFCFRVKRAQNLYAGDVDLRIDHGGRRTEAERVRKAFCAKFPILLSLFHFLRIAWVPMKRIPPGKSGSTLSCAASAFPSSPLHRAPIPPGSSKGSRS